MAAEPAVHTLRHLISQKVQKQIAKQSVTGVELEVLQFLSRMEVKNFAEPGINQHQVPFQCGRDNPGIVGFPKLRKEIGMRLLAVKGESLRRDEITESLDREKCTAVRCYDGAGVNDRMLLSRNLPGEQKA